MLRLNWALNTAHVLPKQDCLFLITASILITTLLSKFTFGGWVTVLITSSVIVLCLLIRKHYMKVTKKLYEMDLLMTSTPLDANHKPTALQPSEPTAVIMIGKHRGIGVYNLLWVLRMFPGHFKNFIFLAVGIVDVESFMGKTELYTMQEETNTMLQYFINYCQQQDLAAQGISTYGTDPAQKLAELAKDVIKNFPNSIFFASKLILENDSWFTRLLHNEAAETLQRRLHLLGAQLVILPMKIGK